VIPLNGNRAHLLAAFQELVERLHVHLKVVATGGDATGDDGDPVDDPIDGIDAA
jgi:hypothetical protein